jgi:hypothetical protein
MPVWEKGYSGRGVAVTILDDGIQTNHPDLVDNYVSLFVLVIHVITLAYTNVCKRESGTGQSSSVYDL